MEQKTTLKNGNFNHKTKQNGRKFKCPNTAARKKQTLDYFESKGIDVNATPEPNTASVPTALADNPETNAQASPAAGMTSIPCMISIDSILVYTHITVTSSIGTFTGSAGGLGVGDMTAAGVLYYSDEAALLATEDFGVFFGSDMGGVCQVTWGANGNATATGVGDGGGAFGGTGSWS